MKTCVSGTLDLSRTWKPGFLGSSVGPEPAPYVFTFYVGRHDRGEPGRGIPMDMYMSEDGTIGDFHLVHLHSLAMGGAGLVFSK